MKHRLLGAGLGAVAALALAAPAQAQSPDTTYYFQCSGPQPAAKIQNPFLVSGFVDWNQTKPTASFTSGAGCGYADAGGAGANPRTIYDAVYEGVHEKAVEKISVELHNLVTSQARQGATPQAFEVWVSTGPAATATTLARKTFTVTPVKSSTGATEKFVAEFTGLKIKPELGRRLRITINSDPQPQAWVHGASEIPAGVTFTEPAPLPAPAG